MSYGVLRLGFTDIRTFCHAFSNPEKYRNVLVWAPGLVQHNYCTSTTLDCSDKLKPNKLMQTYAVLYILYFEFI